MKVRRLRRYKEKLERIERRTKEINEWKKFALKNERDKLATYKAFQEISEASMDIVAMILKDIKKLPEDDYVNIEKLANERIIDRDLKKTLEEINGLRNRIVHEYNGLNDKIALESIEHVLPQIKNFVGVVNSWLKKH